MATISLGFYLWKRIHEAGVNTILGVPGDFNLQLLDHIYHVDGLRWVGNANELNAAYAADGYARVKNGAGCLVTTHGVGELSALNGIAGAMTEQVKVIHVVGQTTRSMQKGHKMIHHSIGFAPDHQVFNHASRGFRVAAAELQDKEYAPAQIDRVLHECFVKSGPVYIFFPLDMCDDQVPAELLNKPLDLSLPNHQSNATDEAAEVILKEIKRSRNPAVLVDCLVQRHNAVTELRSLLDKLKFPIYTTNMGKSLIDEDHPNYVGVYNGTISSPGLAEAFERNDLLLMFGSLPSDTNTGGFSRNIIAESCIDIAPNLVTVRGEDRHFGVYIKQVIAALNAKLDVEKLPIVSMPKLIPFVPAEDKYDKSITQSWVWGRIAKFLQPGDVVFGETGTAAFGLPDTTFPRNVSWITQTYYGSIGYATPAALGTELALEELANKAGGKRGRTVLVTGDGSMQLTVQEIGTMIAQKTRTIILLINNDGYTIERVIHGAKQGYNDISPWNYSHTLRLFGMSEEDAQKSFFRAETKTELDEILNKDNVLNPQNVIMVEIKMDKMDVPWKLMNQVATRGPETVRKMKEAGFVFRGPPPKT